MYELDWETSRSFGVTRIYSMTLKPKLRLNPAEIPPEYNTRLIFGADGVQVTVEAVRYRVYISASMAIPANAILGVCGDIFVSPGSVQIRAQAPAQASFASVERWESWTRPSPRLPHPLVQDSFLEYRATFNTFGYGAAATIKNNWAKEWKKNNLTALISKWDKTYEIISTPREIQTLEKFIKAANPDGKFTSLQPSQIADFILRSLRVSNSDLSNVTLSPISL